ncbi:helix-turn-helix domain-containing protein [Nitratireductor sp. CAU 1489]|uniref:Helix-turn-helix domain-containing protein n=2 Tax=Nitratireductor arenosus TaxID=2682096 RepID=A0A844QM26_9HYPH|nr:helix-turn-helix domain-containing protein [Nitratireductor arenosus]
MHDMAQDPTPSTTVAGCLDGAPFLVRHPVHADLCDDVVRILGYRENGVALDNAVEMAPLAVPLILGFGEPFQIALGRAPASEDRYDSFTSGLYPGFVLMNSTGRAECIQIDFTPLGARRFFGIPMREIAQRMVHTVDLGDRDIVRLRDRLGAETDWRRRFGLVEAVLRRRLERARPQHGAVAWAYERILASQGTVRIGALARSLDCSRKHLNQRFHEEIGIGPKSTARMVRFNRALTMARFAEGPDWALIAADCGYADQAHLVREFRAFSGAPPSALPPFP